jgi:hypothetical protein
MGALRGSDLHQAQSNGVAPLPEHFSVRRARVPGLFGVQALASSPHRAHSKSGAREMLREALPPKSKVGFSAGYTCTLCVSSFLQTSSRFLPERGAERVGIMSVKRIPSMKLLVTVMSPFRVIEIWVRIENCCNLRLR